MIELESSERIIVLLITPTTIPDWDRLVGESVLEGHLHIERMVKDYMSGVNLFNQPGEALFGAFAGENLVGVGGLNRDPYSIDSNIGRVRRLYVSAVYRRHGVGRILMKHIMEEAGKHFSGLTLRTSNPVADLFYRSLGFSEDRVNSNNSHFYRMT